MKRFAPSGIALMLILASACTSARDCPADAPMRVARIDFTAHARSVDARDRMLYLPAGSRAIHVHVVASGQGTLFYRWYRDDRSVAEAQAVIGSPDGHDTWDSWSNLALPDAPRSGAYLRVLGPGECVLAEATLAVTPFAGQPQIREALTALAMDDAIGARIALNSIPDTATDPALHRFAQQLRERDVAIARAAGQTREGRLFLVESTLRDVERRLGASLVDRALRERIGTVRRAAAAKRAGLRQDDMLTVLAVRHLLETEKLVRGDYPLLREDAMRLLQPALEKAGDDFTMTEWQPTLRGYRLLLQDKRTGESFVVTPD